jgi:hypothetical protein
MAWDKEHFDSLREVIKVGEERIKQLKGFLRVKKPWTEDQLIKIKIELEQMKETIKVDKSNLKIMLKTVGGRL